jgi:hypothetical protein
LKHLYLTFRQAFRGSSIRKLQISNPMSWHQEALPCVVLRERFWVGFLTHNGNDPNRDFLANRRVSVSSQLLCNSSEIEPHARVDAKRRCSGIFGRSGIIFQCVDATDSRAVSRSSPNTSKSSLMTMIGRRATTSLHRSQFPSSARLPTPRTGRPCSAGADPSGLNKKAQRLLPQVGVGPYPLNIVALSWKVYSGTERMQWD